MPSGTTPDHTSTDKPDKYVTNSDGSAFNTRHQTCQCLSTDTSTIPPDVMPDILTTPDPTPRNADSQQTRSSAADAETEFIL